MIRIAIVTVPRGLRCEDRIRPLLTALAYFYSRRGAVMTKHSKKVISTELDMLLSVWSFDRAFVLRTAVAFCLRCAFSGVFSLPLFFVFVWFLSRLRARTSGTRAMII